MENTAVMNEMKNYTRIWPSGAISSVASGSHELHNTITVLIDALGLSISLRMAGSGVA